MKLVRHSLIYFLSRGIPALVSIAALAVYTRLLGPNEYGRFILVIASATLLDAILLQWLYWSMVRFSSGRDPGESDQIEHTLLRTFHAVLLISLAAALIFGYFFRASLSPWLVAGGYLFFASHGWYSLHLHGARSQLVPTRFGLYEGVRATVSFGVAVLLVRLGLGALGLLLGMTVGRILPTLLFPQRKWWRFRRDGEGGTAMARLLAFGLPLGVSTALAFVINLSDRLIIGAMSGEQAAGLYGAGYDLVFRALVALMTVLNLAGYPLVVSTLEREGEGPARDFLRSYFTLFLLVAGLSATAMALLAPEVATILLGAPFRPAAIRLIPFAALALFLSGVRTFYFNYAFQLGKRTMDQVWVSLVPAALNVGLNIIWIPRFGIQGAIYASALAFALALLLSMIVGRWAFRMPLPLVDSMKALLAIAAWSVVLYWTREWVGVPGLVVRLSLAALPAALLILLFDLVGLRSSLLNRLRGRAA